MNLTFVHVILQRNVFKEFHIYLTWDQLKIDEIRLGVKYLNMEADESLIKGNTWNEKATAADLIPCSEYKSIKSVIFPSNICH